MSWPHAEGTAERLYNKAIRMARVHHRHKMEMQDHHAVRARDTRGRFVPNSLTWLRWEDGAKRHLPWFLATDPQAELRTVPDVGEELPALRELPDPHWLMQQSERVRVWALTFVAAAVWLSIGWGFEGAATIVLAVAFVRRLLARPS
jgi:hypothetical protein